MANRYLKPPPGSPLRSAPTNAQLLHAITTQLQRIANTLHNIAYHLAINHQEADWEIRERLGLPHTHGDTTCPPRQRPTKS